MIFLGEQYTNVLADNYSTILVQLIAAPAPNSPANIALTAVM